MQLIIQNCYFFKTVLFCCIFFYYENDYLKKMIIACIKFYTLDMNYDIFII